VDCRIAVWFGDGALTLASVAGPVVWNEAFRKTADRAQPAWLIVHGPPTTFADLLAQQTKANLEAIDTLCAHAAGSPPPEVQRFHHHLEIARTWEYLGERIATCRAPAP
jgi:NAD-dependent oxidoreductase involved in siderophore biosynthesis